MTITLTHDLRYGDNHASYYITERAELMHRDGGFALLLYSDALCDGLHCPDGHYMSGSNPTEWTPVTADTMTPTAQAIVDEWIADGWTLAPAEGAPTLADVFTGPAGAPSTPPKPSVEGPVTSATTVFSLAEFEALLANPPDELHRFAREHFYGAGRWLEIRPYTAPAEESTP